MTDYQKRLRDEAAEKLKKKSKKLDILIEPDMAFKDGHDFAFSRAKVLEDALEKMANSLHQLTYGEITLEAREALRVYREGK